MPNSPTTCRTHLLVAAIASATILGGCGGNSGGESASSTSAPVANHFAFAAANFVDPTTSSNPYHPLVPGTQWIRAGTTEVGSRKVPHSVTSTMTDVVRTISGVTVVAMLDQSTDSGEISQVGFDWMALDKDGNVWILGGYTEDYEGGVFTNAEDAWLGAETGGTPGVLMPGVVKADTPRWFIGAVEEGDLGSLGEPVEVGIRKCVAFGCFDNVISVREGEYKAIDNEVKYYAPGIGVIFNDPHLASLHQDSFELTNVVDLTPDGLAEASQVVLDLEEHARTVVPDVYGSAAKSHRLP